MKFTTEELMTIRNLVYANAGHYKARLDDKQPVHHRDRCKQIFEKEQVILTKLDAMIEGRDEDGVLYHGPQPRLDDP